MAWDPADVLLEDTHKNLLTLLAEAARSVPISQRQQFAFSGVHPETRLHHPGLPDTSYVVYIGDLDTLTDNDLIRKTPRSSGSAFYDVTPKGFEYYAWQKQQTAEPVEAIEETAQRYLQTAPLQERHAGSLAKWLEARSLLWNTDSDNQLTTVGHLCREAMQLFASELVDHHKPSGVDSDVKHTVARLKSVLEDLASGLGSTETPFLLALVAYWGTVGDLVERQVHGAQKEGEMLTWEDARRIMFHTAIVMFEVDKSLSKVKT